MAETLHGEEVHRDHGPLIRFQERLSVRSLAPLRRRLNAGVDEDSFSRRRKATKLRMVMTTLQALLRLAVRRRQGVFICALVDAARGREHGICVTRFERDATRRAGARGKFKFRCFNAEMGSVFP